MSANSTVTKKSGKSPSSSRKVRKRKVAARTIETFPTKPQTVIDRATKPANDEEPGGSIVDELDELLVARTDRDATGTEINSLTESFETDLREGSQRLLRALVTLHDLTDQAHDPTSVRYCAGLLLRELSEAARHVDEAHGLTRCQRRTLTKLQAVAGRIREAVGS